MPLTLLWLQLAGAAIVILFVANFLAKSADVIAFKTGLGRSFIGVVLLATATSLPELGTGISAVALVDEPDLAAGDAFGSNLFNLLIIGLLDIFWRNRPILTAVSHTSVVIGALGVGVISLAGLALLIHGMTTALADWYISPVSIVILIGFVVAMYVIYRVERSSEKADHDQAEDHEYAQEVLSRAILTYTISAAAVVAAGVWLAGTGDSLADEMGWEASFVGTQFLAFSTSLPELAASFAAIRLNAPDLAISNVLGSNLFNMGLVLFLDDVAFTDGALWSSVSQIHSLTAVMGILMTAVVIVALVYRPRPRLGRFWTPEAIALIALYLTASVLVFYVG